MKIEKLELNNFRNYENLFIEFSPHLNIFIGDNAQGKTNILESIYLLAITKSHRTFNDQNMLSKGSSMLRIKGMVIYDNKQIKDELEMLVSPKGKLVSINQQKITRLSDYVSRFNVIAFSPEDLDLIKGSPSIRRRFLNIEIGQLNNEYVTILNEYMILLKARNEYLKSINLSNCDHKYLDILTDKLIDIAVKIYKFRKNFVADLNDTIQKIYNKIFNEGDFFLKYETDVCLENMDEVKKNLGSKFKNNINKEILIAQTTIGPHRDDFGFYINNRSVKDFCSQGQQRTAVLCLKLGELTLFKDIKKEFPVLLLDDIFSELDTKKRNNIIKNLSKDMQIVITTTDINSINQKMIKKAKIFSVNQGVVTLEQGGTHDKKK